MPPSTPSSAHPNQTATRYFLDTSAQVERWAGTRLVKDNIRSRLGAADHGTSRHVLREWKHVVESTCLEVLNALDKSPDFPTLFASLSQGFGRDASRRLRVLSVVFGGERTVDLQQIRLRCGMLLRQHESLFMQNIDLVADHCECGLTDETPSTNRKGERELKWRCKKTEEICERKREVEATADELRTVGAALIGDSRYRAMGETAQRVADNPIEGKGQNCWRVLGDVSIALDCGEDDVLLTTDQSFEVIGPALGKQVERIAASS